MNKITKISFTLSLLFSILLMASMSPSSNAQTASSVNNRQVTTVKNEPHSKQLNANIQAQGQPNNMGGDRQKVAEGSLAGYNRKHPWGKGFQH